MKTISLTQGQVALVDDDDFSVLSKHRWYATWRPDAHTFYAVRKSPRVNSEQRLIRMHREILRAGPGDQVDHRNHNGLDNRLANLRIADQRQNNQNRRKLASCSSPHKGICWSKDLCMWRAYIRDGEEASAAYCQASRNAFGEFSCTDDDSRTGDQDA